MDKHRIDITGGTAHELPPDMRKALASDGAARTAWEALTPLARNEWICWVTFVKKVQTRRKHITRLTKDLRDGERRPCCWIGCIHRTDKKVSPSVRAILERKAKKV